MYVLVIALYMYIMHVLVIMHKLVIMHVLVIMHAFIWVMPTALDIFVNLQIYPMLWALPK